MHFTVLPKLGLPSGLPLFTKPLETLSVIFPYAATMAAVGCIESLLTMQLIDGKYYYEEVFSLKARFKKYIYQRNNG